MYYVVQLDSNIFKEKIVVPSIWLDKYNTLCLLPPVTDVADVETLAKAQSTPKHGWQMHNVTFIQSFDTYSEAKESIKKGKPVMIELEEDEEEEHREVRGKRKRKLPLFLEHYSIESDDDEEEDHVATQNQCSVAANVVPDPLLVKMETMDDSNAQECHQQPRLNATHNKSSSLVHSSLQHDSQLQAAGSSSSTIRLNLGITPALPSASVIDVKCSNCHDLEKRMISMQQEILSLKKIVMDINKTTHNILTSVSKMEKQNVLHERLIKDFKQMKTTEELFAFGEKLTDSEVFSKMILYFSAFGGKDAHSATRKIMSVLMCNSLARNYNWIGSGMKRSFQEHKGIIQLVAAAVRHNKMYKSAGISEIEKWIARWLRYASDRDSSGGRKTKKNKLCVPENLEPDV